MKYKYERNSSTIRRLPQNYWVCSVKDNKLVFDSWEKNISWVDKAIAFVLFHVGYLF